MSDPNVHQQTLIEQVAVPAFFEKVAADAGVTPNSAKAASDLRVLGDQIVAGVGLYLEKVAAAYGAAGDDLIKAAAETAARAVGIVPQQAPVNLNGFLAAPGVMDAASELAKLANADCYPAAEAVGQAMKEDEDEEEKKKKEAAQAVTAA